jgi:hypothetical protein
MLNVWQSLHSARQIKFLLLPVYISSSKFQHYFQIIKQFSEIELKEITRDPTRKSNFLLLFLLTQYNTKQF